MPVKQVVIDARMLLSAGIGTYLQNLIPFLKTANFSIKLIVSKKHLQFFPILQEFDLIFLEDGIYSIQEQLKLPQKIPKCDLFWSPHYNVPIFPIRAKKRLVTIHDVFHLAHLHTLNWKEKIYAKTVIAAAVKFSERIITDSLFSQQEILRLTNAIKEKIEVITLGVDHHFFSPSKKHISKELPKKYFLYVGNIKPHKNLLGLVQAFQMLLQEGNDADLILIGKQKELKNSASFQEIFAAHPLLQKKVHLFEDVKNSDLPFYFNKAIALVFPSFYEGFGLPPLEAMSSGCTVIVSHAASLPEVCGDAAYYVDPYNAKDIKEKMKRLLEDGSMRDAFIQKGFSRAEKFHWKDTAIKHIQVIHNLLQ